MDIFAVNLCTRYSSDSIGFDFDMIEYFRVDGLDALENLILVRNKYNSLMEEDNLKKYLNIVLLNIKKYGCYSITLSSAKYDILLIDIENDTLLTNHMKNSRYKSDDIVLVYNKLKAERRKQNLKDLGY